MPLRCTQVGIIFLKLIQPAAIMAAGQNAEMAMELPDGGFELCGLDLFAYPCYTDYQDSATSGKEG